MHYKVRLKKKPEQYVRRNHGYAGFRYVEEHKATRWDTVRDLRNAISAGCLGSEWPPDFEVVSLVENSVSVESMENYS